MSHSIFSSALGRAILRRTPSGALVFGLKCTFTDPTAGSKAIHCSANYTGPRDDDDRDTPSTKTTDIREKGGGEVVKHQWIARRLLRDAHMAPHLCHRRPKTLLGLLHLLGRALDVRIRPHQQKTDLTFSDPLAHGKRRKKRKRGRLIWRLWKGPMWSRDWMGRVSLKSITYEYMYHFILLKKDMDMDTETLGKVFGARVLEYLVERGYGAEDVVVWAWILMARNEHEAAARIDIWARLGSEISHVGDESLLESFKDKIREIITCNHPSPLDADDHSSQAQTITRSTHIPPFIILHNLRRPQAHINARILQQLFPHVEKSLFSPHSFRSGDFKTPLLTLIRLLRHARSSWPVAIPHVADLLSKLHPADKPPKRNSRLTNTYNRLLMLLSLPPNDRPFQHMPLLQQSQFTLLRKMAALDVPINRSGYRALISVQLAHPKTPAEAQHVNSLSTTWPPWPVARDGHRLSQTSSASPHLSRAAQVLDQMMAAGYQPLGWEKEAAVLAGTDTDASPTIQTRTFYQSGKASPREQPANIWAVRIRATRTLDEAWSIFLEASAAVVVPSSPVWEELLYKVASARKVSRIHDAHSQRLQDIKNAHDPSGPPTPETLQAVRKWDARNKDLIAHKKRILPGDAREISIPPAAPSERVYVPVPPPSVEELLARMQRVAGKSARVGPRLLAYLVRESESLEAGERLLNMWAAERFKRMMRYSRPDTPSPPTGTAATYPPLLTSYLTLLLRTPTPPRLDLSLRLLRGHLPRHPPPWNAVLASLITTPPHMPLSVRASRLRLVHTLYTLMTTHRLQTDAETLRLLCAAAERARSTDILWDGEKPVDVVVRAVQGAFTGAVPAVGVKVGLPALHAYVRVLGWDGRVGEIRECVEWVRGVGEGEDGLGRRVLVAAEVFGAGVEGVHEEEVEGYVVRGWTTRWKEERGSVEELGKLEGDVDGDGGAEEGGEGGEGGGGDGGSGEVKL